MDKQYFIYVFFTKLYIQLATVWQCIVESESITITLMIIGAIVCLNLIGLAIFLRYKNLMTANALSQYVMLLR